MRGAANLTDRTRKAVMVGYSYDWVTPTDYRQQAPELVEKLSPMERYLVGEPVDDNPHFDFTGGPQSNRRLVRRKRISLQPQARPGSRHRRWRAEHAWHVNTN